MLIHNSLMLVYIADIFIIGVGRDAYYYTLIRSKQAHVFTVLLSKSVHLLLQECAAHIAHSLPVQQSVPIHHVQLHFIFRIHSESPLCEQISDFT